MQILLPAVINPPRIRKDRSISISFDSRELLPEEMMSVLALSQSEGWLSFCPNQDELPEIPKKSATVDLKSASERLRDVIYVWYKQETDKGRFIGIFDTFYNQKMDSIIESVKDNKLDK